MPRGIRGSGGCDLIKKQTNANQRGGAAGKKEGSDPILILGYPPSLLGGIVWQPIFQPLVTAMTVPEHAHTAPLPLPHGDSPFFILHPPEAIRGVQRRRQSSNPRKATGMGRGHAVTDGARGGGKRAGKTLCIIWVGFSTHATHHAPNGRGMAMLASFQYLVDSTTSK